ncbi:MAG TPA: efflux RND transporter periplasmic adaptor subunit [Gallionella sp.]|nr:efflux RND transporter periplasmic adaptor subunit [Gallionella sp.]
MIKLEKQVRVFVILGILLLAGGVGYRLWSSQAAKPMAAASTTVPEQPAATRPAADTVRFAPNAPQLTFLQIKPVEAFPEPLEDSLNARIVYDDNHTARVFSPIAGRVVKIDAEAGRQVKAGEVLLSIDAPDFVLAAADSLKADADLVRKKEAFERAKLVFEARGLARKDLEQAEADWHLAEAEAQRAKARLKNLNANAANAEGKFLLRAPVSGLISERQVNAGSEVRPDAANPLFVITDPRRVWVLVDLPEQQLGKVKAGQPIAIEVDAYPGEVFRGKVTIISETLDPVTRRIPLRCEVDNSARKLRPEMFARVMPLVGTQSTLPRVPNSALFTQGLYSFLFVELSPGVLQRRRVTPSMQGRDFTYLREGLKAGERVVTSGALLLNSELAGND